jgi:prepilin-type N-terminal cleavage/methylation domain-containing protein
MFKRLSSRKSAGFTMVEMVVAAAILVVTVGGFYATFGGANQYAINSRLQNSAKVILGAALNETLGTTWIKAMNLVDLPEVLKPTSTFAFSSAVPYSLAALPSSPTVSQLNAGISPTMPNGVVSLFTDPSQTTVIQARLDRIAIIHPERNDMTMVGFRLTFIDSNGVDNQYRGRYIAPVYAYTIVARLD